MSDSSATPLTIAHQASLSMGFPRQKHWSGLLFPFPGDLPNPGIKPASLALPALAGGFFTTEPPGNPELYSRFPLTLVAMFLRQACCELFEAPRLLSCGFLGPTTLLSNISILCAVKFCVFYASLLLSVWDLSLNQHTIRHKYGHHDIVFLKTFFKTLY